MEILRLTSEEISTQPQQPSAPSRQAPANLEIEDLYCILQAESYDSQVARELARRLRARGRSEEALKILRNVVKIDSCFITLAELAQTEYELEMMAEAFVHLQQAIMIAPEDGGEAVFEVYKTLGNIFVRNGDLDSAEDCYNKAFRLLPESDSLQINLGTLNIQRQAWDEAAEKFSHALTLNPMSDRGWLGLALVHRVKGDQELAWGCLQSALELNELNEVALGLLLDWSVNEGREFQALEQIRKFLLAGGWNERFSLAFAWLSWRRGERFAAELELERLLAVNPLNDKAIGLLQQLKESA